MYIYIYIHVCVYIHIYTDTITGLKSSQLLTISLIFNFSLDASLFCVEANQGGGGWGAGSTAAAPSLLILAEQQTFLCQIK